jgi:AraC-like DNA-binding protein
MDPMSALLDGPRARSAFVMRSVLTPPWSLRIRDEAPLTFVTVVRGSAWLVSDDAEPIPLQPGDAAILRGPDHYTVADDPRTPPQVIIHPGQRCTTPDGEDLSQAMDLGVRTWGNDPHGETLMLTGSYHLPGEVSGPVLSALPASVVVREEMWDARLIPLLRDEAGRDDPGQEAVLDRLLDLMLIAALRGWFSRPEAQAPAWYRAQSDPVVGTALRAVQNNPAHHWTLAALAAEAHVSRAALARRFTDLVGEPPMTYLTRWRLLLAADLLRASNDTIAQIAGLVGYRSPFALSTAFKRVHGVSPHQYRRAEVR